VVEQERTAVTGSERAGLGHVLAEWGGMASGEGVERLSGLTNRIYKVPTESGPVAVRLPGSGTDAYIDRVAEAHNAHAAAGLGIGPQVLHAQGGAMVTAFLDGRVLSPETMRAEPDTLAGAGRLLRLLHDAPVRFAGCFDAFDVIAAHRAALIDPPADIDALIARIGRLAPPNLVVPCHNDPWPENFLDVSGRLHLLDWEYSAMGDPAWDLADLMVECRLDDEATERFLGAYAGGPVAPALRERVAAMGPVTDLLWGLWSLVQVQDGNDAMDFATYGNRRLRRAGRTAT
jgi:thiamine kinase-like enzyme